MEKPHSSAVGITDKYGKQLHVGDIVQYYLSDIGPGGPFVAQIARNKKGVVKLITPGDPDKIGVVIRHTHGQFMTLLDTQYRGHGTTHQSN